MPQKIPEKVRRKGSRGRPLDNLDRKILGALSQNADHTFAELGRIAGLSPAATHDRVRKLREGGHILGSVARINPESAGRPLLAFISVSAAGWCRGHNFLGLQERPEIEEIHVTAGDDSLLLKVRVPGTQALEDLLEQLYALPEVRGTSTKIVLSTPLARGTIPLADDTQTPQHINPAGR